MTCLKMFGPHWYPTFRPQTSLWLKFWDCWKDKHGLPVQSISSTPRYVCQRIANRCPHNKLDTVVHSSIIHNSQKLETTWMFINLWMDKQNVVYPHSWVLFSHKKIWSTDTCYNMDKLQTLRHKRINSEWSYSYAMSIETNLEAEIRLVVA